MGYSHKGKILENGEGVFGPEPVSGDELNVNPEDDGLHIIDFNKGDFEWWYFDILDRTSNYFLKIVIHIGTDPLRTKIFPQVAVSVNMPGGNVIFSQSYAMKNLEADTQKCNVQIGEAVRIWTEPGKNPVYFIKIDIPGFKCDFKFTGEIEGWKPLGNEVPQKIGRKKGSFSWIIPVPKAKVEGNFRIDEMLHTIPGGTGYHDHNYIRIDKHHPLYLDELITKWYWGKCTVDKYMVIFMDTWCRTNRLQSLMVAENDKIIYSANNLLDCSVLSVGYDSTLRANYPEKLRIQSKDEEFNLQAEFDMTMISDRKDLLEGVNPVAGYLIKKLVARPVYFGIFANVKLRLKDGELEGYGNFETMYFRDKCRITYGS